MAIQGKLKIAGKTYSVIQCEFDFSQATDETGKPSSRTMGGTIRFVMPATSDDDLFFYRWMFDKTQVNSGIFRFRIYSNDNRAVYKSVAFGNAYCIGLKDYFNDNDSKLMYTTITLSAEIIRIGSAQSATYNREWSQNSAIASLSALNNLYESFNSEH